MTFKKNWLSILLWVPFSLFICAIFGITLFKMLPQIPFVNNIYLQSVLTAVAFLLVPGIFLLCRKAGKNCKKKNYILLEAIVFAVLLGAGIFVRCIFGFKVLEAGPSALDEIYYHYAMVNGSSVPYFSDGMDYLYLLILRGLFLLFGNHLLVGYILQAVLQCLACIFWYVAIRQISGSLSSVLFMECVMLLPQFGMDSMEYSPKYLYLLLFSIVMMFLACILKNEYMLKPVKWYGLLLRVLLGLFIGILIRLDITGLLLLIPVLALAFVSKNKIKAEEPEGKVFYLFLRIFSIMFGAIAGFCAAFGFFIGMRTKALVQPLPEWLIIYKAKEAGQIPWLFTYGRSQWAMVAILFILVLGAIAFFARKKEENQIMWMLMLMGACSIHFSGFYTSFIADNALLLVLTLALCGAGLHALFAKETKFEMSEPLLLPNAETTDENVTNANDTKSVELAGTDIITDIVSESNVPVEEHRFNNERPTEKPRFIENPLPLPKKHVKKTLGYGKEVPDDKMFFDIDTSDLDDFDI